MYEKYIKFTNRHEIHRNPNFKGCPTPDCEGFLKKPLWIECEEIQCNDCNKIYCFKCLHEPHQGETCEQKIEKDYEAWASPN